jgi:hypothetical protein
MATQAADLTYGAARELFNHSRIEKHLGCALKKLGKYDIMDWEEIPGSGIQSDEAPLWKVEQKARKLTFDFCKEYYKYNGVPTCLIGKHKLEYMKSHGCGIVYFDFTDKLMYWVFDEEEYKTFAEEKAFLRNLRTDYYDRPAPVIHIPCSKLRECEVKIPAAA